jgi:amino acid transporter/ubiquinone/menaquinone biosynthesis C-methylase UbiE
MERDGPSAKPPNPTREVRSQTDLTRRSQQNKLGLKEIVAMGVGGMVGGGIFSVLGLAIKEAGHAAPIAFAIGGVIAMLTGYSYTKLGLAFHSDGGSFTYLEHAFKPPNVAGLGGWVLLVGYIGTLSLYAYTFGVYGAAMLGGGVGQIATQHLLASLILLVFLGVNLYGVQAAGKSEDIIVLVKVLFLSLFAVIGLAYIRRDYVLPVFNQGGLGVVMGAALIFVAYEGFELIPNAVNEMQDASRDLSRGIMLSIGITVLIYILVSLVAVGNLLPAEIVKYEEYALAVAAKPFLGQAGFLLIGIAALLSTASAINATLFGTARLGMAMAQEQALPKAFSLKERHKDIPWLSLVLITAAALLFVNTANLTIISSFASATFLLIFSAINLSALRLRKRLGIAPLAPLLGLILSSSCWIILIAFLWQTDKQSLSWISGFYLLVIAAELLYSERRLIFQTSEAFLWRRRRCSFQLSPRSHATMSTDVNDYEPGVLRIFQTKSETKAYYNKIAKVYDLLAERSEQPMREKGLKQLDAQTGERILEVGFGTGHCVVELARAVGPTGRVFGIDISEEMVALTDKLLRDEGLEAHVELTCGDAASLPFEDNSLDGIFTSFTFELFDTPEIPKVLAEWKRALKPSGRLVVVAMSKEGKQGMISKAYEWTHRHFPNLMDCRPIFVSRAVEAAGLVVTQMDIESMWVPVEIVLACKE